MSSCGPWGSCRWIECKQRGGDESSAESRTTLLLRYSLRHMSMEVVTNDR